MGVSPKRARTEAAISRASSQEAPLRQLDGEPGLERLPEACSALQGRICRSAPDAPVSRRARERAA